MSFGTEQEKFWNGTFGDEYVDRNNCKEYFASNIHFFSRIVERTQGSIENVIEFGSNVGLNLKAIKSLIPNISCSAIEINHKAVTTLREDVFFDNESLEVFEESILEFEPQNRTWDFVLIKGVLIHINPLELQNVYKKLYDSSKRYICIAEYYNPTPVSIMYRGEQDKLFKRDFAGEFMDLYPSVKLVDYGFSWHRDNNFEQDDLTWFLLEK